MVTPDIAGFIDAQQRLRANLGRVVTFWTPVDVLYDPDVPVDPDTRAPYDPTIQPAGGASAAMASASAVASVVFQPLTTIRRAETSEDALGVHSRLNKDLILDIADAPIASGARYFDLDGESWEIVDAKVDGIGSEQRYVVFGEAR